jgi:hypothetical protein
MTHTHTHTHTHTQKDKRSNVEREIKRKRCNSLLSSRNTIPGDNNNIHKAIACVDATLNKISKH